MFEKFLFTITTGSLGVIGGLLMARSGQGFALSNTQLLKERAKENMEEELKKVSVKIPSKVLTPWIKNCGIESTLKQTIKDLKQRPGVAVFLAPHGAGKSQRAIMVAEELKKEGVIRGYLRVQFNEGELGKPLYTTMLTRFGVDPGVNANLSELVGPNSEDSHDILLIVDQVEAIANHPGFYDFFTRLAKESANQPYRIISLAILSESKPAEDILQLNGGEKVWAAAHGKTLLKMKWTRANCEELVDRIDGGAAIPEEARSKLLDMLKRAGCASVCRDMTNDLIRKEYSNEVFADWEWTVKSREKAWEDFARFKTRSDERQEIEAEPMRT